MGLIQSEISRKYFLITLVVILLVLSSVYGLTVTIMNDSFQDQIRYRDQLISRSLTKRVDFTLQMIVNDMRMASIHSLERGRGGHSLFTEEIQRMLVREPLYLFIRSVDADGAIVSRIPEPRDPDEFPVAKIVERLRWSKTWFVSNLIVLPDGRRTFVVAHPVIDGNDTFRGGVLAFVDLDVLSGYLDESRIGPEGMASLLDRNGTVVAHTEAAHIGRSLRAHPLGEFLKLERYGIWEGPLFSREMLVAYRPMALGTFGLIVGEPVRQARAPSDQVMMILFQGFLVVLIVASALTLLSTSRVARPITALIRQTNEYKENRRKSFDPIRTGDEIEVLSRTMDEMANALTERERRLFYILESIPYAIITLDRDGRITTFNRGAEELTGFARSEVVGKPMLEVPFKATPGEFISLQTLQEGKSFDEVESYILDKAQNRHDVRMHSALYEDEEGTRLGAIIVIRDVGDLKKMEEYVRKSEQLAALGQLTAGIAHEIKNPLSIIQAAAEGIHLELDDLSDKKSVRALADDILKTSDRMNALIKDFLSLAFTPEEVRFREVDLIAVIDELLLMLKKKFRDQDVAVVCDYETGEAEVLGHKSGLTQVFLNILLNSLQAMPDGGTLRVRVSGADGDWEVALADTGTGIAAAQLPWIFNPFFSTKIEGTGLGLSIAHEIVTEHQGKIWAESVEGEGTTFYIQIPRSQRGSRS